MLAQMPNTQLAEKTDVAMWESEKEPGLLCLPCAADSQECLVSGLAVGRFTDRNFPPSQSIHALLGGNRAAVHCVAAGAGTEYLASKRRDQALSSQPGSSVSARIRVWNLVVCGDVLLDLQHHASVRRCECTPWRRHLDSLQLVSGPLPRRIRIVDQPADWRDFVQPSRASSRGRGLGWCGTGADAHYWISMGLIGNHASR